MTTRLSILLPLLAGLASVCAGLSVPSRHEGPGFLSFPIEHSRRVRSVVKRQEDSSVPLFNVSAISYLIELSIGTPGQSVKVAIDTGSDELWVNPDCNDPSLTRDQVQECTSDGFYNIQNSKTGSTAGIVGASSNSIPYGKGNVSIDYVKDDMALPGSDITLKDVQFGVATASSELNEGIVGLAFGRDANLDYSNFIDIMQEQKVTNSKAFSIALGSADSDNGGVAIFGGVDTKKFAGPLMTNAILGPQFRGDVERYYLQLDSISRGGGKAYGGLSSDFVIVLDSGSSLSYLPPKVLSAMAQDLGASFIRSQQIYMAPCSLLDSSSTLDFDFGNGTVVKVPVGEFILQLDAQNCVLGALPMDAGSGVDAILGDTFMRAVYVVFDQTTKTISMAPFVNCGQNEQAIPASGAAGFKGECDGGAAATNKNAAAGGGRSSVWGSGVVALLVAALVLV
ncbi:aspartic peptidase domain-containing protein [Apodospora peruviana]|uniref:Aspartic peptidase domain-containing protein n=1 Tax=Apodospora peruviana TaxID=516989 RepID=A0AAE0MFE8_9PEZI|nr:aspartic peptidase domain-containing protein [Apodospora peruviana]